MSAPDLIVCGARVHGVEGADAVALSGERVAAVGGRKGMLALRSPATHVVDLPGALICAGFHDAHGHLVPLAEARREIDLHGLAPDAIRDAIATAASSRQPGRWIVGRGFDPELFRGTGTTARALLDAAAPRHAVLLRSHDFHSVAMNSAALLVTGFLEPREVDGGVVDRDAAGEPTGILRESAALVASAYADDLTPDEVVEATARAARAMLAAGVTSVHDMSGSRHVMPGAFFREPTMPRRTPTSSGTGSAARAGAVSRIIRW